MLHPVLPPSPAAIQTSQATNQNISKAPTKLVALNDRNENHNYSSRQAELSLPTLGDQKNYRLIAETPAKPTIPEILPPELTPSATSQGAVLLGEGLAVGYPLQQENIIKTQPEVTQSVSNSRNLSQPSAELLVKKLAQSSPSNSSNGANVSSGTFPSSQPPVNIEFYAQNQQNTPATIEFKSRQQSNPPKKLVQAPQPNTQTPGNTPVPTPQPNTQTPYNTPVLTPQPNTQTPGNTPQPRRVVEVISDYQEYDEQRRVVTAEGNVVVRFDGAVVDADRLQVNLDNLIAVGSGNVALTRGDQVLRGQRFTYNFVQDNGELERGSGEIFIPTAGTDLGFAPPGQASSASLGVQRRPLSDRIRQNQPLTGIGSPGGIDFNVGGQANATNVQAPRQGGQVRRVRFEAAKVNFYPRGWQARDVKLTNDPFSPPELELRADKVTLTQESPQQDRIKTQGQRLVFDQRTTLPIPIGERTIDRRERDATPVIASIGYDGEQRGGLFIERSFEPFSTDTASFTVTPQFYVQKTITGSDNFASLFGLKSRLNAVLSSRSRFDGTATFETLDFSKIEDSFRANLRYQQALGAQNPHLLNLEYSYRDRFYNGTLGFQRVQSSLGGVLLSPVIPLGTTGLNFSYQASAQYIDANTDRLDLLQTRRENDRISLGRFQTNARLFGGVSLWEGKALPPTRNEGLRYTPNPLVPYIRAYGEINGTTSFYTSGDNQSTLLATAGLQGQFGNFSKPFLDYTAFNISYTQGLNNGLSPFLFDRAVDNKIVNLGVIQQLYGPFRLGFQTSINIDNGQSLSTEYSLEYSRRTYGITLRYNPVQELGGISFRISDFNWTGGTDPFSDETEVKPVVGGVEQR
jgi:lipopolysaccharide export system protein LptA